MSENIDGGLAYKATINIDDFNVSAEAMERRIRNVSSQTAIEAGRMDQSIQSFAENGAKYIVGTLVAGGMMSLVSSIVETRGLFQQLDIAFTTMLGSGTQATMLMNQLKKTAVETPFNLTNIAQGAKQLLAYGFAGNEINDTLVRLGNIASGLSLPLDRLVFLYGTTMTQGRLYARDVLQFTTSGIPLIKELASMYGTTAEAVMQMVSAGKIGFPEVKKVIENMTNEGGKFHDLMQKQSKAINGMLSNVTDYWKQALNEIGESNQSLIEGGINGVTYLVQNLDGILNILKAVAIGYGTVKAAIILNTLATKGNTGVALIDNTVKQAKIALMKADAAITGKTAATTQAMTAANEAHTASLLSQLTVEEQAVVAKNIRIATIRSMLTAQQQEYLANLGLTASSANYEAVATGELSVEQRQALSKLDLTAKSAMYRAALENEVMAKTQSRAASIDAMRDEVKVAAVKLESAKATAISSMQIAESARYDVYWAKQSGDATRIASAEKKLEGAVDNQSITRKAALAAQTDFLTKKKQLETAASAQSTTASVVDTAAKETQTVATSFLSAATGKLTLAMKTLWASMKANPIGWILSGVGLIISALSLFSDKGDEAKTVQGEFQDATKKSSDELRSYITVLQNTENGSNAHKKALEKVNAIAKEYNKTLLNENSTLAEQQSKYEELTKAIQAATAEKIKAKYTEAAMTELADKQAKATDKLKNDAKNATYDVGVGTNTLTKKSTNIRESSQATWDILESMAIDAGEKLKTLTGSAYTQAFNESLNTIVASVQRSTRATDDEMKSFRTSLYVYLTNMSGASKDASYAIDKATNAVRNFRNAEPNTSSNSVDYIKMSFEDLDKKAQDTRDEIDKINAKKVKVNTDNTKLDQLYGTLQLVNSAIDKKTNNLNTETGIKGRIKELQDERANVEINSKQYKELGVNINKLQQRLPKNQNTENKQIENDNQYKDKQIQADLKLEEARIQVMEEGYAKRKALLDLQHRKSLAEIDKEERELATARKKSGKGGLTQSETNNFDQRRSFEDQNYTKAQNKLFDGEIDYKKQQYQLYWRWVDNMGQDIADKQFHSLLAGGTSFKDYLEKQIADLTARKKSGTLTEGEGNQLINLNIQYKELTGAKSAIDLFKDSLSEAVNNATTLAEKLQAIDEAKKKLENGTSGIVGADNVAAANLTVNQAKTSVDKEIQKKILADFKTFEERRIAIVQEYALLRNQKQVEGNQELLTKINRGEADALSALNAENLMQSQNWKDLFTNLDALSAHQIEKLINNIQGQIDKSDLKLNPVDYKALTDSLNQAKEKLVNLNPFEALQMGFDNYIKALKELKQAERDNLSPEELNNKKKALKDAAAQMAKSIAAITDVASTVGNTLSSVIDSFGNSNLAEDVTNVTNAMAGLGQTGGGVAKIMAGDIVGGIKDVVSGIGTFIMSLNAMHDVKYERDIKKLQTQVDALSESYKNLKDSEDKAFSTTKADIINQENANLENQNALIQKQINDEEAKKKTDKSKIADWQKQIADNQKTMAENSKYTIVEAIMGTDIQSAISDFATAYADAWAQGEKAAGKSAEVVKNLIKTAIIDQLKNRLSPEVTAFMQKMSDAMKDGIISDAENDMLKEYEKKMEGISDNYLSQTGSWLKDSTTTASTDPLTGAVKSMSEETGGVVAGRLNAFVINQSDQIALMRQSLLYEQQTATNTGVSASELKEIKETLKRIEIKDNSLLSKGIAP